MKHQKILLLSMIVVIIFSIIYLESLKPKNNSSSDTTIVDTQLILPHNSNETQNEKTSQDTARIQLKAKTYQIAKELVAPQGYFNIENNIGNNKENITLAEYIGKKVILVDFWTYSCINCQRTIPYLNSWYEKYKDQGLIIIGVHPPEFEFEKDYLNVKRAIEKFNIHYPVVQDNDYNTWRAYKNRYWPRKYLIDIDGFIIYDHIGEGAYTDTEQKIIVALQERNDLLKITANEINKTIDTSTIQTSIKIPQFQNINTPELYFGYNFNRGQLGNQEGLNPNEIITYTLPQNIKKNKFYLQGIWKNNADNMEVIEKPGKIILKYDAKTVNIVAGSLKEQAIKVFLDGKYQQNINISHFDLYQIIDQDYGEHTLELELPPGIMMYTFTFG